MAQFKGLEDADILALMATRTRNQYAPKAVEFLKSDEKAINVKDVWPLEFGEKSAASLYQGFKTAVSKDDAVKDLIFVKKHEDNVFLINTEKLEMIRNAAVEEADAA